ncbi:hypothetical protein H6F61_15085 [Cyanobacteria bacterium FACHB-472]|nr:hypothetical protein [Cyanobacteria bacterium FACHB-472]
MKLIMHWVKDVVFCKDKLPIAHHQAAINWSIIRTIVINVARCNGYESLTTAQRMLEHDVERIFFLLELIVPACSQGVGG